MKKKKNAALLAILFLCFLFLENNLFAQNENNETKFDTDFGVGMVSSYAWRGAIFNPSVNIQPWVQVSYGNFAIGSWGSYNLDGTYAEPDWYANYTYKKFSIQLFDFYGQDGTDFFNYRSNETAHTGMLDVKFAGTSSFPIQLTASVLVYGADKQRNSTDNNFSSYFEVGYSHSLAKGIDLNFFVGAVLFDSPFYQVTEFAVINTGLKASKKLKISDTFSIPIHMSVVVNPNEKKTFYVFGMNF